jgi:hypothetical protein
VGVYVTDEVTVKHWASLFARRFIQRKDVKAIQIPDGEYRPLREPWRGRDIVAHLKGSKTYGHYMVDQGNLCKLFAFDIDLETTGSLPRGYVPGESPKNFAPCNPRELWGREQLVCRPWMVYQFRMIAEKLAGIAQKELEIQTAVAYSGNKGVHVYCFTGPIPAKDARDGAQLVLDTLGEFELVRGNNFWKHRDTDPVDGFPNLSVEVFPKQAEISADGFGNLMRLPGGIHQKSKSEGYFLDCTAPLNDLRPLDFTTALEVADPWAGMR